jgi:hypothetical protein
MLENVGEEDALLGLSFHTDFYLVSVIPVLGRMKQMLHH